MSNKIAMLEQKKGDMQLQIPFKPFIYRRFSIRIA